MEWIESIDDLALPAKAALLYLAHRMDSDCVCNPGRRRIARAIGAHANTVTRAMTTLERRGIVDVTRERSRRGNLYYKRLTLCIPDKFRVVPLGTSMVRGASTTGILGAGQVNTSSVLINSENIESKTFKVEIELEGEKPASALSGDLHSNFTKSKGNYGEKEEVHRSPPRATNDTTTFDTAPYRLEQRDYSAIEAALWWDIYGIAVVESPLCCVGTGGSLNKIDDATLMAINASKLASEYSEGTQKSPRARVAYWHALGRLFCPQLPRFRTRHRLTHSHSDSLHSIFERMGVRACYVLAWTFLHWGEIRQDLPGDSRAKAPNIDELNDYAVDFISDRWMTAVKKLADSNSPAADPVIARLLE